MAFPTDLTNAVDGVTEIVADHLNNLERKVGIDHSGDAASLDYLLRNSASSNPGHRHTLGQGATDVTATAAELNLLDLGGLTAGQVLRATGAASAAWGAIQAGDLPSGIDAARIANGTVSNTVFQYLANVSSDIQAQINGKAPVASPVFTGNVGVGASSFGGSANRVLGFLNGVAPASAPGDTVQLWAADREGTAGKAGLHIMAESGTMHVLADYVGIGTATPTVMLDVNGQGRFAGNVTPASNEIYNLGTSSNRWNQVVAKYVTLTRSNVNVSGAPLSINLNTDYSSSGTYYNRGIVLTSYVNPGGDQTADNAGYDRGVQITHWLRKNAGTINELTGLYCEYGAYGPSGADLSATITTAYGLRVTGYKAASATIGTNYGVRISGVSGTTAYGVYVGAVTGTTTYGIYQQGSSNINYFAGNVGLGASTFGASAAKVLAIGNGTAPTSAPADVVQLWSADINGTAGKAGLHMLAESGTEKLVVVGTILKTTSGDPSQVHEGLMVINTADKAVKIYAGGAWRSLATWT